MEQVMTTGKDLMISQVRTVVDRMKDFVADTDEKFTFIVEWKKQAKASRVQVQDFYKAVTDFMALVRAVAVGQAPEECLQANQVYLNEQARKEHEKLAIDGVKAVPTKTMATR